MKNTFISVEGPIGVGKTTLTNILAKHLDSFALKEIVEDNPYLKSFYENVEEYAFQTEMFFLCNRIKQLEDVQKKYLDRGLSVVSDYNIIKNLVFAGLNLQNGKFQKYRQVYAILADQLPQSDIIIYLYGDTDLLMKRIEMRDRPFERNMSRDYIDRLNREYQHYFDPCSLKHYFGTKIPKVISINVNHRDFVNCPQDVAYVLKEIQRVHEVSTSSQEVQSC
ncbi:deoxyguanosine kinase [Alkaliphilus metalliredigens QYMF]|uniref:Deoxyguanosine kinase n=1 Tax=Alkaliphilus metalliredigens (strain QYMF) TaxID=293826 RepID=A6TVD9_ALKMQ|nr:deoxynucleoside kinase [Alkaliphilus metalliredigens]ABR50157.1 deoxyguanosine kinase [Alkaliphilus metalliredigens QYMF]